MEKKGNIATLIFKELVLESDSASDCNLLDSEDELSLSDTSTSSTEDERCIKLHKDFGNESIMHSYTDDEFKHSFRMNRKTVYTLIGMLHNSSYQPTHLEGREKINAETSFLITLWYLVNQESFREVSKRFNVTESSTWRILRRVVLFLTSIAENYIQWPSEQSAVEISNKLSDDYGIMRIIGIIGCSRFVIKKFFYNRKIINNKKGHSIIVQGVVDNNKKFVNIFCSGTDYQSEETVLTNSALNEKAGKSMFYDKYFLIGDDSYTNRSWLVRSFSQDDCLSKIQSEFNCKHAEMKMIADDTFRMLKERFERLHKFHNNSYTFVVNCITAACVLHNICIDENEFYNCSENNQ